MGFFIEDVFTGCVFTGCVIIRDLFLVFIVVELLKILLGGTGGALFFIIFLIGIIGGILDLHSGTCSNGAGKDGAGGEIGIVSSDTSDSVLPRVTISFFILESQIL